MPRPRFLSPCNADRYVDKSRERVAEFSFPDAATSASVPGGLISLRYREGKPPLVQLYRVEGCDVTTEQASGPNRGAVASLADVVARLINAVSDAPADSTGAAMVKVRKALASEAQRHLAAVYPDVRDHNAALREALRRKLEA